MKIKKVALVVGGYFVAFLAASTAVALHTIVTTDSNQQASGGMNAFGDLILFVAVFGLLSLLPTGAALLFLRPYGRFWKILSITGLLVSVTGIVAVILFTAGRHASASFLATLAEASVLRILAAPFLALIFLVCAAFSPHRFPRFAFLAATVVEFGIGAYGGIVWLVPLLLHQP